jgi:expansin
LNPRPLGAILEAMRRVVILLVTACGGQATAVGDEAATGPSCAAVPAAESGDGTYYAADGTGNCSFDASPDDLMVAAMNAADYGDAAWCGACVDVTGPMGEIVVRIVDQCPGCQPGDLDLSQQAFTKIAALSAGRVKITWHEVACDVTGPVAYQLKDGSNAFYTAIQLRNTRYPVATLEARDGTGTFQPIARLDYNYFVASSGLGAGPFALRVTDTRGQVLEDDAVALTADQTTPGAAQFPVCP